MTRSLTIYHNPSCSKSREAKAHLEQLAKEKDFHLQVMEYLKGELSPEEVKQILGFLVEGKGNDESEQAVYEKVLRSNTEGVSSPEDVLEKLGEDYANLQRPIVVNWAAKKAVVCRVGDAFPVYVLLLLLLLLPDYPSSCADSALVVPFVRIAFRRDPQDHGGLLGCSAHSRKQSIKSWCSLPPTCGALCGCVFVLQHNVSNIC